MIPLPSPSPSPSLPRSMSENPLQNLSQAIENICNGIRSCLFTFTGQPHQPSKATTSEPLFSFGLSTTKIKASSRRDAKPVQPKDVLNKVKPAGPVTKEELGRVTWTFLHTLAAQYPDNPTRQQKKDVKELMAILSRMYPCKECADHFKEVLRANPVRASSHAEFSQWLCQVHNVVNRSLGKPVFPCERIDARWGKLECEQRECDLLGTTTDFGHS